MRQLKKLHDSGYVFLDLHGGNVLVDTAKNEAYLIDGGHIAPLGGNLAQCAHLRETTRCYSVQEVHGSRQDYPQFAPELWYLVGNQELDNQPKGIPKIYNNETIKQVRISPALDVYAFGSLVYRSFRWLPIDCRQNWRNIATALLINHCLSHDPSKRPSIDGLIRVFEHYKNAPTSTFTTSEVAWQEDNAINFCNGCGVEFGFFTRKHHCRRCLKLFCDACTKNKVQSQQVGQTHSNSSNTTCQ